MQTGERGALAKKADELAVQDVELAAEAECSKTNTAGEAVKADKSAMPSAAMQDDDSATEAECSLTSATREPVKADKPAMPSVV